MEDPLRKAALDYHRLPKPGKISVTPTKGLINQRDLGLALLRRVTTLSASSPTARRCWGWVRSARSRPSR